MEPAVTTRLDHLSVLLGAILGCLVGIAFLQWGIRGLTITIPSAFAFALLAGVASSGLTEAAERGTTD